MKRWLPHVHKGSSSDECPRDVEEGGREGHYLAICWLGWKFEISLTSLAWERRYLEKLHAEWEAEL